MRFTNRAALITAGASGIGEATVERIASEGGKVLFCDIAEEKGRANEKRWKEAGYDVAFVPCDVTDESAVKALVASAVERFGRIDVACNIVGGHGADEVIGRPLHECDFASWQETVTINLGSVFLCLKHEIAAMLESGGGAIGNVSSMVGMRYSPFATPAYAAAKAGVVQLTAVAANEYATRGIRVNAISPGLTSTPALAALPADQLDAIVREYHPNHRVVSAQSQAATLAWLCSDDAIDITGLTIPVDGGWYSH